MKFVLSKPLLRGHPILAYFSHIYLLHLRKKQTQKLGPLFLKIVFTRHLELFFLHGCVKNALAELFRKKKTKTYKQLKASLSGFNNSWKATSCYIFLRGIFNIYVIV